MNIDFSSLSKPIAKQDVQAYTTFKNAQRPNSHYSLTYNQKVVRIYITIGIVVLILTTISHLNMVNSVLGLIFLGVLLIIMARLNSSIEKDTARLYRFAVANNAHIIVNQTDLDYEGTLFKQGRYRTIDNAAVFTDEKEIGNYKYVLRTRGTYFTHAWGYMRVKLKTPLPHILLDSKKNSLVHSGIVNLPSHLSMDHTVHLENSFNDDYTLYVSVDYRQSTPDVFIAEALTELVNNGLHYNLEIVDDYLYLYTPLLKFKSEENIREALVILEKINTILINQTESNT
ncbi:MAG: hypothetical protein ACOH18_04950 [Candidatus Saccharimonadaceae bacterium]